MTSCIVQGTRCNCDQNNNVWTEDSGVLTDKNTLPVTELRFGDTGRSDGKEGLPYPWSATLLGLMDNGFSIKVADFRCS